MYLYKKWSWQTQKHFSCEETDIEKFQSYDSQYTYIPPTET